MITVCEPTSTNGLENKRVNFQDRPTRPAFVIVGHRILIICPDLLPRRRDRD